MWVFILIAVIQCRLDEVEEEAIGETGVSIVVVVVVVVVVCLRPLSLKVSWRRLPDDETKDGHEDDQREAKEEDPVDAGILEEDFSHAKEVR